MVKSAKQVILVADSTKFNQVAFASIAPINQIHSVVTDTNLDPQIAARLQEQGMELILA
jgi:DeoR/GlpR family transcriptional regulator of sugar metabolism